MNQPETLTPGVTAPLQQLKGHLLNKGYSYREVKEEGAVIVIFRASGHDLQNELTSIPPLMSN